MADIPTDSTQPLNNQPAPPDSPQSFGFLMGQNYDTQSGSGSAAFAIHGSPTVDSVPAGPNNGYGYVVNPGVQSTRGARVRTWLSGRVQPMFSYPLSSSLLTSRGLLAARRKTLKSKLPMHPDSVVLLNGVWNHETYGTGTAKGHQLQIEVAANSEPTCGKVPAILERIVGSDTASVKFRSQQVIDEGKKSLYAAAGHNFVYGNHPAAPVYNTVSQVTIVADTLGWAIAGADGLGSVDPQTVPNPDWNCSRVY